MGFHGKGRATGPNALVLGLYAAALVLTIAIASGVIVAVRPGPPKPTCRRGFQCPHALAAARPLLTGRLWRSRELGYRFEFRPSLWNLRAQTARSAILDFRRGLDLEVRLVGAPASERSPLQMLADLKHDIDTRSDVLGLHTDPSLRHTLLGPSVGYLDGIGGAYAGTLDTPQGPGGRVFVDLMAATDGRITIGVEAITAEDESYRPDAFYEADGLLNTLRWPSGAAPSAPSAPSATAAAAVRTPERAPRLLGPTDRAESIRFSLVLPLRERALDRYLADLRNPRSPRYRRFLDARTFGDRFGLAPRALRRVRAAAAAAGLGLLGAYPQRTELAVAGGAGTVETLFGVRLRDYVDASGRRFHSPLGRARARGVLAALGVEAAGLSSRPQQTPEDLPGGGLTPKVARRIYDVTPLHARGILGQGETVAIVSFDSFHDRDVHLFDRRFGIGGPPVKHVPVQGGAEVGEGSSEVNLDIDTIRAMAPKAQILDFEAPGDATLAAMFNAIVADGRARIVSNSWGPCDDPVELFRSDRRAAVQALKAMVAHGMTMFVASGDRGAYDCQQADERIHRPTVDFPSDTPWTVSVGGTYLEATAAGGYLQEFGWEDVLQGWGGGGGNDPVERRPTWQRAPGVIKPRSNGRRQSPDVSAASDPNTGFASIDGGSFGFVGGTSAAAPFWAGSAALVAQYARRSHAGPLGFLAPLLYRLARSQQPFPPFHDVTQGGNRLDETTPGWDYSTGLGSPDVWNLARDVARTLRTTR